VRLREKSAILLVPVMVSQQAQVIIPHPDDKYLSMRESCH